jgi:subtilisin-like proprotein convertase family protein
MLNAASYSTPILNNNTTYYWRVRSNSCLVSNYSSPYSFITSSVCGQTFTDSGGPQGNYGNDELQTWVFCPDNQGEAIRIVFSSFNIEPLSNTGCWDHLTVYDGDSTAAPQIGQFCGTSVADAPGGGTVTASGATGCLTFVFDSDVSVTRLGWEAIIHCLECSAPIISKVDVEDESCIGNEDGKVTVTATGVSPLEYVLTPMGGTDLINTTGVFTGLGADTYTLITRFQSDTTCKTSPQPVVVNSELPEIEKVSISEKDCFGDGTATIIINSNLSSGVEYVLTGSGAGVNPLINSSGIFSDLPVGTYSVTVRTPSNINCKSMDSTIIIPGTMPPVAENLEICLKENIGMNEGLSANCGEEICNRIRVAPNKDINAASTTVCDTIAIHGHTDSVAEIYLSLKLQHAWVGDLSATLESPNGTVINLFDRPGHPSSSFGCSQNNLNLVFADTATQTAAVLEATCNPSTTTTTYAIEGAFKPIDLFAGLNGENANGNWKICIYDHFTTLDHGILEEVVLIVNPRKVITTWWDAPTGGNLLHTGAVFNPLESNNNINTNTTGSYSYWAACECINCPSERTQVDFQVSGEYYYEDSDGDGYGNLGSEIVVCKGANPPANYVTNFSDCDDSNSDDYNRQINDNPITAGEYLANSSITSTGMILENTALVTFQAKDSIVLKPGFTIAQNASFIARIDSCGKLSTNVDNFKNEVDTDYYSKVQQTFKQAPIALNVYPNPFNNLAKIEYELKQKEKVSLLVYDSFGRLVKSYINNKQQDAGSYSYLLEGARLNAGLYIVILKREETMISKRLILSK